MEEIKILIVEDDPLLALQAEMLVTALNYQVAGICDNAFDALDAIHLHHPDIILLDIRLKGEYSGIDLAQKIPQPGPSIIFVTSFADYETFSDAKKTAPFAYITKPYDEDELRRAIELAMVSRNSLQEKDLRGEEVSTKIVLNNSLFIKNNEKLERIFFDNLLWIEADGNYVVLNTTQGRYAIKLSLTKLEENLDPNKFTRIHRNYIVNLNKIQQIITSTGEIIVCEKSLPLGRKYKDDFFRKLKIL